MENKLLTFKGAKKEKNALGTKQIIAIIISVILIIVLLFLKTYFNSPNRLKRYLQKENYECATNTCEKNNGITSHLFNYKNGDLTVTTDEYIVTINDSNYIYNNRNNNLICTYDNDGKIVTEEHNNPADCSKYHDAINNVINYYNLTMDGSKFKTK